MELFCTKLGLVLKLQAIALHLLQELHLVEQGMERTNTQLMEYSLLQIPKAQPYQMRIHAMYQHRFCQP